MDALLKTATEDSETGDEKSVRILIIEDEKSDADLLSMRLLHRGYTPCAVAESGKEAIQKAIASKPDLALVDIRLHGEMDGIDVAKILRSRYGIPCIFVTAHDDSETLQRASRSEAYAYIIKPFTDRELFSAIEIAMYKHEMERALDEKQQWLGTTLRSIGDAVIATDTHGSIRFMNPVAELLSGWTQSVALGRTLEDVFRIIHESTREAVESPTAVVLRTGVAVGLANHTILLSRDGREIMIDDCASPIKDETGALTGVVLVFRDVTERKRATQNLRRSEEHYRSLFERNLAGVYKSTLDGKILDCNDSFASMLGFASRRDVVVHSDLPLFESAAERNLFLQRVKTEIDIVNQESSLRTNDGNDIWVIQNASFIDDPDLGGLILGTVVDITSRRTMELELRAAKERAEQSDKLKASILSNLSHEIRTPLNIILGYAGVIKTVLEDRISEEEQDLFTQMDWGAKRLMRTVENIINISKIQAGMYQYQREIVDITAEICTIVDEMRMNASQKEVDIELITAGPVYLCVDRYAVDQAFINLIDNAVKFTQEGRITVELLDSGEEARVTVRDTGVGIASEYLGEIFSEFVQEASGLTRSYDGLGLGLPLTKKYIEGNGGSISLESLKGVGTNVTVCFPSLDLSRPATVAAAQILPGNSAVFAI